MIKVFIIPAGPDLPLRVSEINEKKLEDYQALVGGYIEAVRINLPVPATMYVNEEGLLLGLPVNKRASYIYGGNICGDAFLAGPPDYEGEDTSISSYYESLAS